MPSRVCATFVLSIYSSKVMCRSMMPPGMISIIRFATVFTNSWSWAVKRTTSWNLSRLSFKDVMDSRSRWLVGSSSIRTLDSESIIFESMQRTFSPPESTPIFLMASSPEKSIRPKKVRAKLSPSVGGANCRSHSIRLRSPSKKARFSLGK